AAPPATKGGLSTGVAIAAGIAIASAAAGATWLATRPAAAPPSTVSRFALTPTGRDALSISPGATDRDVSISPDGTYLAYRAGTTTGLLAIRRIDQLEPQIVRGTANIRKTFFSSDGQWLGVVGGPSNKKVSVTGGPAIQLCRITGANPRGASWGDDNTI